MFLFLIDWANTFTSKLHHVLYYSDRNIIYSRPDWTTMERYHTPVQEKEVSQKNRLIAPVQ
jgi:hypothetical protein